MDYKKRELAKRQVLFGDLPGARTQDPHIKSVMLYLLSYQVIEFISLICECKNNTFLNIFNKNFYKNFNQGFLCLDEL